MDQEELRGTRPHISFGLVNETGILTNAGALLADECPIRWSRVFCTRWNGKDKSGGVVDALDDAEYSGSLVSLLENGEAFILRNARKMWRKTPNSREEMPDYVERSYHEALINALVHRDPQTTHRFFAWFPFGGTIVPPQKFFPVFFPVERQKSPFLPHVSFLARGKELLL